MPFTDSNEVRSPGTGIGKAFVVAKPRIRSFKYKAILALGINVNEVCMRVYGLLSGAAAGL